MNERSPRHRPVMTAELLDVLDLQQSHTVIDATFGFGGHASVVLEQLGPEGQLIGFERDPEVYEQARGRLDDPRVTLVNENYRRMKETLPETVETVDAVYFDMGVSSYHLDSSDRGFSFRRENDRLDCRFDPGAAGPSASEVLNQSSSEELRRIFKDYGEVRNLGAVVGSIMEDRPVETVGDLKASVEAAVPYNARNGELARVFQALRIVVNDELESLEDGLQAALDLIEPGGTLAAISYHSLEDRRVKQFLRHQARECVCPPDLPVCACDKVQRITVDDRSPITPSKEEIEANPRARSATLRAGDVVA